MTEQELRLKYLKLFVSKYLPRNIKSPINQPKKTMPPSLNKIVTFLADIGIEYCFSDASIHSFLNGIAIEKGQLIINPKQILCIGDILHEAGHLACLPSDLRPKADGDIGQSLGEEYTYELGVIAWTVAAAKHLDIPLEEIFHPESYKGDAEWLLEQYSSGNYLGLPLLQWMGLAAFEDELEDLNLRPYPNMKAWLRA